MLEKKTLSYVIVSSYHWDSHKLKNSNIQVNNPYVRVQSVTNEKYISVSIYAIILPAGASENKQPHIADCGSCLITYTS